MEEDKIQKNTDKTFNMDAKRIILVCAGVLFLFLFIFFIVKPTIIGYSVYNEIKGTNYTVDQYGQKMSSLQNDLVVSNTNLSACTSFNSKLFSELEIFMNDLTDCRDKMSKAQTDYLLQISKYETQINELTKQLDEKNKELSTSRSDFNLLAYNSAKNLCCKAKIDNPAINSYTIENNKIVCSDQNLINLSC